MACGYVPSAAADCKKREREREGESGWFGASHHQDLALLEIEWYNAAHKYVYIYIYRYIIIYIACVKDKTLL